MGTIGKLIAGAGLFALGYGTSYFGNVDRKYVVVSACSQLYVQDKHTGLMAEVEKFDIKPDPISNTVCPRSDELVNRLERAYKELVR